MTETLDTLTNLELRCLGLWILLWTSSGNDRDSGILLLTSSGNDCSNMRGSRVGTRGPDLLWKITSYMRFYGNKHLDPPPPPPWKCWTPPPPPPRKMLDPPCVTVKSVEGLKKRCCGCFSAVGPPPPPHPLRQRFLDPRIAKK